MLAEQRRQQIMLELQRVGQARTRQLAEFFEVSEVTIRSDLEIMDAKKQLIKTHGGAIALPSDSPAAAFEERMQRNFDAKRRIAQMAARQIIDNQSIVFDSGSTLLQVAMQMPPVNNVVVATTAMNIAQHLMYRPGLDVHMIGGRVFPSTVSTIVQDSDKAVGGLVAHQAFVGAHAIDQAFDVVDVSEDIARTKRNLVRMARRVVLVADSSKFDIGASSKAFSLSRVDLIITDSNMPHSIRHRLDKLGVEVRYA
ncbi:DeoR/GlpR transcriptional regulator [Rhizobium sophorae]|uniref:DeoR family transcriptional regulator of aga operon n=3 Tax=Rhizobium TaxID=379 RepID=A0A7W6XYJ4_9HYPH|nr:MULTISPECIES: DeoR/GlpR family DNA-binding transcription regulator [Rhizobium]MBX4861948.1 DeoR/GlpR transcriptional regulator [Rhizobium bangladeshense]NKK69470.1 DeoR family transcriptional regulator [Rhizobium leguminosarum bv. viciae]MBB4442612.1 DeoR family transcriptional regulator of aga operon [Rhizobium esperanzae]MCH4549554.1 DeoR/GlpR family DNA-binding transcription regulator [Rhizobium changzhiense]MCV9945477.1 DeoR/GlpR family DNA-binding transcription regulator [Rhizobium sp.